MLLIVVCPVLKSERGDAVEGRIDSLLGVDVLISSLAKLELTPYREPGRLILPVAVGSTKLITEFEEAGADAVGTVWLSSVVMLFNAPKELYIDADLDTDAIIGLELAWEVEDATLVDCELLELELRKELKDALPVDDVLLTLAPLVEDAKLVDNMIVGLELV